MDDIERRPYLHDTLKVLLMSRCLYSFQIETYVPLKISTDEN